MNKEMIKEVFSNEEFVKSLLEMKSAAEVQSALQAKGVELSEEEILSIRELLDKVNRGEITKEQLEVWQTKTEDGKIPEEALAQVSGGFLVTIFAAVGAIVSVGGLIKASIEFDEYLDEKKEKENQDK